MADLGKIKPRCLGDLNTNAVITQKAEATFSLLSRNPPPPRQNSFSQFVKENKWWEEPTFRDSGGAPEGEISIFVKKPPSESAKLRPRRRELPQRFRVVDPRPAQVLGPHLPMLSADETAAILASMREKMPEVLKPYTNTLTRRLELRPTPEPQMTTHLSQRTFSDFFYKGLAERQEIESYGISRSRLAFADHQPRSKELFAVFDFLVTSFEKESFVKDNPWLEKPFLLLIDGMEGFDRLEHLAFIDVVGFETADFFNNLSERFGLSHNRGERFVTDSAPLGAYAAAPGSRFARGFSLRPADAHWHVRYKMGVGGWSQAVRHLDDDTIALQFKLEALMPRLFGGALFQSGIEYRPLDHDKLGRVFVVFVKPF